MDYFNNPKFEEFENCKESKIMESVLLGGNYNLAKISYNKLYTKSSNDSVIPTSSIDKIKMSSYQFAYKNGDINIKSPIYETDECGFKINKICKMLDMIYMSCDKDIFKNIYHRIVNIYNKNTSAFLNQHENIFDILYEADIFKNSDNLNILKDFDNTSNKIFLKSSLENIFDRLDNETKKSIAKVRDGNNLSFIKPEALDKIAALPFPFSQLFDVLFNKKKYAYEFSENDVLLYLAVNGGNLECIKFIEEINSTNLKELNYEHCLMSACNQSSEILEYIVSKCEDIKWWNLLVFACYNESLQNVIWILRTMPQNIYNDIIGSDQLLNLALNSTGYIREWIKLLS
jgi:hypothetical protein